MPSRRPEDEGDAGAAGSETSTVGDADPAAGPQEGREGGVEELELRSPPELIRRVITSMGLAETLHMTP